MMSVNRRWTRSAAMARPFSSLQLCVRNNHSGAHGHGNDLTPVKDRFPPKALDQSDPRRKLAVLVDAQKVDADVFCRTIEPAAMEVGVPVLVRVFDYEISRAWGSLISQVDQNAAASPKLRRPGRNLPIEWFRVERFIPIGMQMLADADHICEYKHFNRIDAVAFVCTELDRAYFQRMLERFRGRGFNQYIFDELGLAVEEACDGRTKDGRAKV